MDYFVIIIMLDYENRMMPGKDRIRELRDWWLGIIMNLYYSKVIFPGYRV